MSKFKAGDRVVELSTGDRGTVEGPTGDDTVWLINRLYKKELEALGIDRWSGSFRVNKDYDIFGKTLTVNRVSAVLNEPVEL